VFDEMGAGLAVNFDVIDEIYAEATPEIQLKNDAKCNQEFEV
jgi:hypothetical protein